LALALWVDNRIYGTCRFLSSHVVMEIVLCS